MIELKEIKFSELEGKSAEEIHKYLSDNINLLEKQGLVRPLVCRKLNYLERVLFFIRRIIRKLFKRE